MVTRKKGQGEDNLGVWDWHTIIFKIYMLFNELTLWYFRDVKETKPGAGAADLSRERLKGELMDYEKLTKDIVELSGGPGNIKSVTHCATRLRFFLNDESKADKDAIASLKGVLGCIFATGQLQIILGKDLLPVYDTVVKNYHFSHDGGQEAPAEAPDTAVVLPVNGIYLEHDSELYGTLT